MPTNSKTIAFRLHESLVARLEVRANEQQVSLGEFTRQIVIRYLTDPQGKEITDAVASLQKKMDSFERSLRIATVSLLCNGGNAEPDEALDWVRNHLGPVDS